MLYMIHGVDGERSKEIRAAQLDAHLAYLDEHADKIVLAGAALADEDAALRIGSVFILNVKNRAEAEAFMRAEPFNENGLFKTLTMVRMRRGQWYPQNAPDTPEG